MSTCPRCHLLASQCTCPGGAYERHVDAQRARERAQRAEDATEGLALFAGGPVEPPRPRAPLTSLQRGLAALHETAAKHADGIQRLAPLARELADAAGPDGITVSDLRVAAVARRLLTGQERGRELSWLGAVMTRAGLVRTDDYRRSDVERSHGNLHRVFVAQEYGD